MPKVKKQKFIKECTNCFSPVFLKFNFSYIVYEDNFENEYKIQLLNRIRDLSEEPYLIVKNRDKKIGLEFEDYDKLRLTKKIPDKFLSRFDRKSFNNKVAIFRLYTNNNPILARIIGVIIKNIFYIFFIDIGGNLYNH